MAARLIGIVIVFTLLSFGNPSNPNHYLEGYDCTRPQNIRDFRLNDQPDCSILRHTVDKANIRDHVHYQLLQAETIHQVDGTKCEVKLTRQIYYCGVYHHLSMAQSEQSFQEPYPGLNKILCQDMKNGRFTDSIGKVHRIAKDHTCVIKTPLTGKSWVDAKEAQCAGTTGWTLPGTQTKMDRTIAMDYFTVTVSDERIQLTSDGRVIARDSNVVLNARPADEYYNTGLHAYLWEHDPSHCYLAVTREFKGVEAPLLDKARKTTNKQIVMSNDGSLVRVTKEHTLSKCSRVVYTTNYKNLFLYPLDAPQPFTRKISAKEMETTLFVRNRDDFLYAHIKEQVDDEFFGLAKHTCERLQEDRLTQLFITHKFSGYRGFQLRNGTFAVSAGEVSYLFECEKVLVMPVVSEKCYRNQPVRIINDTTATVRYLEPITRQIVSSGSVIPCNPRFAAKFETVTGNWISTFPVISSIPEPEKHEFAEFIFETGLAPTDFSDGGVYTQEELDELHHFLQFDNLKEALSYELTTQTKQPQSGGYIQPQMMFPDTSLATWKSLIVKPLLTALEIMGNVVTYALGFIGLFRLLMFIPHVLFNIPKLLRMHPGRRAIYAILYILNPISYLLWKQDLFDKKEKAATKDNNVPAASEDNTPSEDLDNNPPPPPAQFSPTLPRNVVPHMIPAYQLVPPPLSVPPSRRSQSTAS